jgi:hypothetical protein
MAPPRTALTLRRLMIVLLTLFTAGIHFVLAFDWLFVVNGVGYLGLLLLVVAPWSGSEVSRHAARWGLIVYTALTVVLWLWIGVRDSWAYVDKAIEVVLIWLLWLETQMPVTRPQRLRRPLRPLGR